MVLTLNGKLWYLSDKELDTSNQSNIVANLDGFKLEFLERTQRQRSEGGFYEEQIWKKLAAVATVATMAMGMSVSAFAAAGDTTTLATNLYKDGKYDASAVDSNLSMGNGAVEDTTYVENSDGTYTVTLNFKSSFKAMGMKGYLKEVDVDTNQDGTFGNDDYEVVYLDGDSSKAVIGITFTTDSIPTINTKYDAKFSISVLNVMPVNAEGDIVILPGVTE